MASGEWMAARIRMRAAAGAFQNVSRPDSVHQLGPGVVARAWTRGWFGVIPRLLGNRRLRARAAADFRARPAAGMRMVLGFSRWVRRHDLRPRVGCGREHVVVPHEIESRRRPGDRIEALRLDAAEPIRVRLQRSLSATGLSPLPARRAPDGPEVRPDQARARG